MKTTLNSKAENRRARWMIVDDHAEVFPLVRDLCARHEGVEIECFTTPQAALDAFAAQPGAYEFVLTDLEIPVTRELSRRLRPLGPALKILLSAWHEVQSQEEAVEKGFCGRTRKPFPFVALQAAVAPAVLKYIGRAAGLTHGLNLAAAF